MISALESENTSIVELAIIGLANIEAEEAIAPLSRLTGHEHWEVRIYAREAIKKIQES